MFITYNVIKTIPFDEILEFKIYLLLNRGIAISESVSIYVLDFSEVFMFGGNRRK